ncbi:MAG: alkyl hydroperoxide reductase [Sphingomonadales bacterium 28-55-16]|nr:MAG: alkyl hydroperoxide reductase [Sphingomonadales bacterium 28-55-16]
MKRPWLLWVPLAVTVCIGGLAAYGLIVPKDEQVHSAMIGRQLPAFALPPAAQGVLPLSNTDMGDGTPRLLNIFASWCIPCKAEAPQLEALKAAGVEIDGIAIRDRPEDVAAFLNEFGNPYRRIGSDSEMAVQLKLGSSGVPETYVIGADGMILFQHIGDIRAEHVPMLIEKLKATK